MKAYDVIIVLGSQPRDTNNWKFPSHVYKSLDKAVLLLQDKVAPYIAVSGKWAVRFDTLKIRQPFHECDKMADYLLNKGVSREAILKEGKSKDTISNLYYLKKIVFKAHNMKKLLFIAADFRLRRIKFLCERILGPSYMIDMEGVDYLSEEIYPNESHTFAIQKEFLSPMKSGDDLWLDDKFYTAPMYKYWADLLMKQDPKDRMFS